MNDSVKDIVIASYATMGNARRIRVLKEADGSYGYVEFRKLKIVGRGCNYPTQEAIEKRVANLIDDYRAVDGINFIKNKLYGEG
jgi:hypothetical protein